MYGQEVDDVPHQVLIHDLETCFFSSLEHHRPGDTGAFEDFFFNNSASFVKIS